MFALIAFDVMMRYGNIIFGMVWLTYVAFSYLLFPVFLGNVIAPLILLVAIGAWYYGRVIGYFLILLSIPYHAYIMSHVYGDIFIVYQTKAFGTYILIAVVFLVGKIKSLYNEIAQLNQNLDSTVNERTRELNERTTLLVERDENIRTKLGQDIHDGLGQYLTGLLLFSSSLESELCDTKSNEVDRATSLVKSVQKNLHLARKVSRTLFPVKMSEIGLEPSIFELTSYFSETNGIKFNVRIDHCEQGLTTHAQLHIYRIVYGSIINALHHAKPSHIFIGLSYDNDYGFLIVESNENGSHITSIDDIEIQLINYRIQQIKGRLEIECTGDGRARLECIIPSGYIIQGV